MRGRRSALVPDVSCVGCLMHLRGTQVLGDRSLKLKYLNPNTLFVATGNGRTLTASLLDTVSGRFLHRQSHAARAPAHLLPHI